MNSADARAWLDIWFARLKRREIAPPEVTARDIEVREVVARLVDEFRFAEALAILRLRARELAKRDERRVDELFLEWSSLPRDVRPDFLTFAHRRRKLDVVSIELTEPQDVVSRKGGS